jgi:hypothetical protein
MLQINKTTTVEEARMLYEKLPPSEQQRFRDALPLLLEVINAEKIEPSLKYDYTSLIIRIGERGYSLPHFAREMGLTKHRLISKLSGQVYFEQDEIEHACVLLNISSSEIVSCFFVRAASKPGIAHNPREYIKQ